MAKNLNPELEHALKQFAADTCINCVGASLFIGSSSSVTPEKSLYRAYLNWCNSTDYFPVSLPEFAKSIVIVMTDSLNWKVHVKKSYGELAIHGIKYKSNQGRVNHG